MASPRPVRNYLIPIDVGEASTIELNVRGVRYSVNVENVWRPLCQRDDGLVFSHDDL